MDQKCAHITVVIHISLFKKLLNHLNVLGINHLYSSFGRFALLNDARGLAGLFRASDLNNEPVEIFYFYTPLKFEEIIMQSIVKVCRLDIPGRGSIFSKHVQLEHGEISKLICDLGDCEVTNSEELKDIILFQNLTQIHCTMSKGMIDDVARLLLHLGVVPTITNASGTGLRDQLGLLRITIPKEKELLSIVVGHQEAKGIMDKMITWGKLDRPGRGFIWQTSVEKGLINFKTSQRKIGQAASPEQIIAAIDSLKGTFSWRQGGTSLTGEASRSYFRGVEFFIQTNEGGSLPISKELIKLGISGATIQSLKTLSKESAEENIVVPQEIIRVVVTEHQAKKIIALLESEDKSHQIPVSTYVFQLKTLRAFNYKNPK